MSPRARGKVGVWQYGFHFGPERHHTYGRDRDWFRWRIALWRMRLRRLPDEGREYQRKDGLYDGFWLRINVVFSMRVHTKDVVVPRWVVRLWKPWVMLARVYRIPVAVWPDFRNWGVRIIV